MSRPAAKPRAARHAASFPWTYVVLAGAVLCALIALATWNTGSLAWQRPASGKLKLTDIPIDGERAFFYGTSFAMPLALFALSFAVRRRSVRTSAG